MHQKNFLWFLGLALLCSACASPITPTHIPTEQADQTTPQYPSKTPSPTNTMRPSATVAPSNTPEPSPTPTPTRPTPQPTATGQPDDANYRIAYLAYDSALEQPILSVIRADGSQPIQIGAGEISQFAWDLSGKKIYFIQSGRLLVREVDQAGQEAAPPPGLPIFEGTQDAFALSPNGKYLAVVYTPESMASLDGKWTITQARLGNPNLGILDIGTGRWVDFKLNSSMGIRLSANPWSPDGKKLLFAYFHFREEMGNLGDEFFLASVHTGTNQEWERDVFLADVNGLTWNLTPKIGEFAFDFSAPAWADEGTKIIYSGRLENGQAGLFAIDQSGGVPQPLVSGEIFLLSVSPNGKRILYQDSETFYDVPVLKAINADGSGKTTLSDLACIFRHGISWAPDSSRLVWSGLPFQGADNLCSILADGSSLTYLQKDPGYRYPNFLNPSWSPDGKRIAFYSNIHSRSADTLLCVVNPDGTGLRCLTDGYTNTELPPLWAPVR